MAEVELFWSGRSLADLEEIVTYIARESPAVARSFSAKLVDAVNVLAEFPTIGRVVPEYGNETMREILYRNYRVVYELSATTATVVTIFHGSRPLNWP